ncbi:MAG: D-alanine--D-alanine ligase family protein [Corynebacterium sp.]|nr:D-alanine--D-alanine ligase family protein [Corynebacterium sp.]
MVNVCVLYGGRSTEHSISCVSARAILTHLEENPQFTVIPVGITEDGTWTVGDPRDLAGDLPHVTVEREVFLHRTTLRYLDDSSEYAHIDVVFPVLHGPYGEDGTIQGLLELNDLPYVGSGIIASACGMDKQFTKKILREAGLPTGRERVLSPQDTPSLAELAAIVAELGLPLYVKPARGGSSIGISKVTDAGDLAAAIALARDYDQKVVIEAEVTGAEIECGVLQYPDGCTRASVPAQLNNIGAGFYDFNAKYVDGEVTAQIPAPLDEQTTQQVQEIALAAFAALDCTGLARVDFFVGDDGPIINEINTMPGFTQVSMYPQVFAAIGIEYSILLTTLVEEALARAQR